MHEKVDHLYAPKTQRQAHIRQHKLPLPLLSHNLQVPFNEIFQI